MRPHARSTIVLAALAILAACGKEGPLEPAGGAFSLGQSLAVETGREARVLGGSTGGTFVAVVVNIGLDTLGKSGYSLRATGVEEAPRGPFSARVPRTDGERADVPRLTRDESFERRLRERERVELTPRFAAARRWNAATVPSLPTTVTVGQIVEINVNANSACTNPIRHPARVMAIGAKSIILNDTLNPKPGFSTADYERFAARFDTLVYPMSLAAFGEPTDIDKNGRIAIVFTRAVNELTPRGSTSYVGGLTFSRDLFPHIATSRADACPASNEGEYFYLMAPDATGSINGRSWSNADVAANSTGVIAHELVHLTNASRKLYVNTAAPKFEEKWLDEGLAHVAEELLFYRESGLVPRSNLTYQALTQSTRVSSAYRNDMSGNENRYRDYLYLPSNGSPFKAGDSLSTRGAAWSLLRYLADRAGSSDGNVWSRLVDNTAVGAANLQSVFGELPPLVRDWAVSHVVDDTPAASPELSQQSWNWRSVYGRQDGTAALYPLPVNPMAPSTSTYGGTVVAGGSSYYSFTVPAEGTATLTLSGQAGATGSNLQLVIVRTK